MPHERGQLCVGELRALKGPYLRRGDLFEFDVAGFTGDDGISAEVGARPFSIRNFDSGFDLRPPLAEAIADFIADTPDLKSLDAPFSREAGSIW